MRRPAHQGGVHCPRQLKKAPRMSERQPMSHATWYQGDPLPFRTRSRQKKETADQDEVAAPPRTGLMRKRMLAKR